jgi:hypothetical protein
MRKLRYLTALTIVGAMLTMFTGAAQAYTNSVTYRGQGLLADGFGGYDLIDEICDGNPNGILENGADAEGPYLLFVLTATGAKNADISFFGATPVAMTKFGNGTFKYISPWVDPDTLIAGPIVATYDGKVKNAQLTVSHGCRPFETQGAWCSPGFWGNAEAGAWALTGYARTDLFNVTVYDSFYGATFVADPTLDTVLTASGGTYKGPGVSGTDPRTDPLQGGVALNAFNATGAFLSDNIPGYDYDPALLTQDESNTCPIDHHGNFKNPQ